MQVEAAVLPNADRFPAKQPHVLYTSATSPEGRAGHLEKPPMIQPTAKDSYQHSSLTQWERLVEIWTAWPMLFIFLSGNCYDYT